MDCVVFIRQPRSRRNSRTTHPRTTGLQKNQEIWLLFFVGDWYRHDGNACPRFRLQQSSGHVAIAGVDDYFDSLPEDLVVGTKPGQIPCSTFAPSGDGFPDCVPAHFWKPPPGLWSLRVDPMPTHNPQCHAEWDQHMSTWHRTLSSAA